MNLFRKKEKTPDPETYKNGRVYDYTTEESRVATAEWLFEQAKNERTAVEDGWVRNEGYYNFVHAAAAEMREALEEQGIDWTPAVVPDRLFRWKASSCPRCRSQNFTAATTIPMGRRRAGASSRCATSWRKTASMT